MANVGILEIRWESEDTSWQFFLFLNKRCFNTVKTLNIGTPRPATVVILNIKQFNFTMK